MPFIPAWRSVLNSLFSLKNFHWPISYGTVLLTTNSLCIWFNLLGLYLLSFVKCIFVLCQSLVDTASSLPHERCHFIVFWWEVTFICILIPSVWKVFHQIHPNWLLSKHHWNCISYLLILMHNKLPPKTKWWCKTFYIICDSSALRPFLVQLPKATLSVGMTEVNSRLGWGRLTPVATGSIHYLLGTGTECLRYSLAVGWGWPSILVHNSQHGRLLNPTGRVEDAEWISSMLEVTVSCSSVSAVTSHHFTIYYSLKASHRSMQHTRAGNYTVVWITGSVDNWRATWGLASRDVY